MNDDLPTDEAIDCQRLIGAMRLVFAEGDWLEQESLRRVIERLADEDAGG